VRLDVDAAGICGSDLHEYVAGPIFVPTEEPHPLTDETAPVVMGHEFSGVVRDVGEDTTLLSAGDRVAVNPVLSCGDCRYYSVGRQNLCESLGFIGLSGGGGGFAEQVVVPARNAIPLREGMSLVEGALVEPFSVGVHAVRRSGLRLGDDVVVTGAGPIGLAVVQSARAAGAERIFVSEPNEDRRSLAAESGADAVIDPTEESVETVVGSETDVGADIGFEVSGVEAALDQVVRSTKRGGHTTVVSVFEERAELDLNDISMLERSMNGTRAYHGSVRARDDYETAIGMLDAGHFDGDSLVTDRIDLDGIVDDGFERLISDKSSVKVVVEQQR
jgi:(R,R)-butanediol dehydrogenase/meso-butanediol dehydrogenase/diacetyl reductase